MESTAKQRGSDERIARQIAEIKKRGGVVTEAQRRYIDKVVENPRVASVRIIRWGAWGVQIEYRYRGRGLGHRKTLRHETKEARDGA